MERKASDALTARILTPRNAAIGAAIAVLIAGGGVGAYAITQSQEAAQQVAEAEPTNTPTVEPTPENVPPTAAFTVTSVNGLDAAFDATASADTDGEISSFAWDFGDGTTGTGSTVAHTYGAYGVYTVTLVVTDDRGDTASVASTLDLPAPPPPPPPAPEPPAAPTYGNYPPGYPMPNVPGTDQPDTSACASSSGTTNANGQAVCA